MKQMDRATIEGIELEYEARGAGEPVVLVHAGIFADWFKPLLEEPALTGRYRAVSYHRIGYAGSSRCLLLSERRARRCPRSGMSDRKCCSPGCQRPNPSSLPARRTCCMCRIRAAWQRRWQPSSHVTRLRHPADLDYARSLGPPARR